MGESGTFVVSSAVQLPAGPPSSLSDRELLDRFIASGDAAAFAAIVDRHGAMLRGLCRRLLRDADLADDVLQATFLVLARKARSIRRRDGLGAWLFSVAQRLARQARLAESARSRRERRAASRRTEAAPGDPAWDDLLRTLDEELQCLPERLRSPLLLCYLEGRTQDEAARQLGVSLSTLRRRLESGRELLRARMIPRGATFGAGLFAAVLAPSARAALTAPLHEAILTAATTAGKAGAMSVTALALAENAMRMTTALKVALWAGLVLTAAGAAAGIGWQARPGVAAGAAQEGPRAVSADSAPADGAPPEANQSRADRRDQLEDPLPPGVLARLGSLRLRHDSYVYAASISPDGTTVASTGGRQFTYLWNTASGKKIGAIPGLIGHAPNDAVAFSPDGKELAVGYYQGVVVHDVQTGLQRWQMNAAPTFAISYSADGKLLATGHEAFGTLLWDAVSGKKLRQLQTKAFDPKDPLGTRTFVYSVAFSPDSKILASAQDDSVVLWDVLSGERRRELRLGQDAKPIKGDRERVFAVAFSPDGSRLASGGTDRVIRLWELATGKLLRQFHGHEDEVAALAFSRDGTALVSGSGAGIRKSGGGRRERAALRLWDVATGKEIGRLGEHGEGVISVGFSKDGRILMSAGGGSIRLWNFASRKEISDAGGHSGCVGSLAFSPDGTTLATGGADNTVRLWQVPSGREIRVLDSLKDDVDGLVFSPKGDSVVAGSRDGVVAVWDSTSKKEKRRFETEKGQYSVALSPDGKTVAAGTWKGTIFVWDMETGKELRRLPARKEYDEIHSLSFSPDRKLLAATVFNQPAVPGFVRTGQKSVHLVRLWDIERGVPLPPLEGHEGPTMGVAFSPDGKRLASASWDATLRLWETATRKQVWQYKPEARIYLGSPAFSPDGRKVACVGASNSIYLCEVASGKEWHRIKGPQTALTAVAFSPNGKIIASAGMDGTVLLWDAESVTPKATRPTVTKHSAGSLESFWNDLAAEDAPRAHHALWELIRAPSQAVAVLQERVRPAKLDSKRMHQLIVQLDSDKFAEREEATRELRDLGHLAEPMIRKARLGQPSVEVQLRLEDLLKRLDSRVPTPEELRTLRAIEILEHIGTSDARLVLESLAKGAPEASLTQEAESALARLHRH